MPLRPPVPRPAYRVDGDLFKTARLLPDAITAVILEDDIVGSRLHQIPGQVIVSQSRSQDPDAVHGDNVA